MSYVCGDIEGTEDKDRCKNKEQRYNQCCQSCNELGICEYNCDYAYGFGCIAMKELNEYDDGRKI